MKILLLSLFVAAAFAAPAPLDPETGEPVELIVNGVEEGVPLELGDVLGIKVKEHVDGVIVSATDLLHPLTAVGIEEAAADNRPVPIEVVEYPELAEIKPEPVELPPPMIPETVPLPPPIDPIELPEPEIPEPALPEIDLPDPILPEIILPEPDVPEILPPVPEIPEIIPPVPEVPEIVPPVPEVPEFDPPGEPVDFPNGEVFNNGVVQVSLNPSDPGVISTLQNWFSMVVQYFNGSYVTTHQIV